MTNIRAVENREKSAVFIGRMSLPHDGHFHSFRQGLRYFKNLTIFIGSANQRCSAKNPFTYDEREKLIMDGFTKSERGNVTVLPLQDRRTMREWVSEVDGRLARQVNDYDRADYRIIGHDKDDSSYYLHNFGQMKFVETGNYKGLNATDLRRSLFEDGAISAMVPEHVANFLRVFKTTERYRDLQTEWMYYNHEEPKLFEDYPYKSTLGFMCSDALVTCGPYVLLIKRKSNTGNGCWALPGGFLEKDLTFFENSLEELKQETSIHLPDEVLKRAVYDREGVTFDSPGRSHGIRRVTKAFHYNIELDAKGKPPRVTGKDDASEAKWFNLAQVREMLLYDDHKDIIEHLLRINLTPSWLVY